MWHRYYISGEINFGVIGKRKFIKEVVTKGPINDSDIDWFKFLLRKCFGDNQDHDVDICAINRINRTFFRPKNGEDTYDIEKIKKDWRDKR